MQNFLHINYFFTAVCIGNNCVLLIYLTIEGNFETN